VLNLCAMFGCTEGLRAKALCSIVQCSVLLRGSLLLNVSL